MQSKSATPNQINPEGLPPVLRDAFSGAKAIGLVPAYGDVTQKEGNGSYLSRRLIGAPESARKCPRGFKRVYLLALATQGGWRLYAGSTNHLRVRLDNETRLGAARKEAVREHCRRAAAVLVADEAVMFDLGMHTKDAAARIERDLILKLREKFGSDCLNTRVGAVPAPVEVLGRSEPRAQGPGKFKGQTIVATSVDDSSASISFDSVADAARALGLLPSNIYAALREAATPALGKARRVGAWVFSVGASHKQTTFTEVGA